MNSFTLTAIGNLSSDPELIARGDGSHTKFCLVGNDYAGKDEHGHAREAVSTVWFTAFESLGETIAKHARKGDQLIVQAQLRSDNWTDKDGDKRFGYDFVVQQFRFGAPGRAKRQEFAVRRDQSESGVLETEA